MPINSHLTVKELRSLVFRAFTKNGFDEEEAEAMTEEIVESQCRGLASHGPMLVPYIIEAFPEVEKTGPIEVVKETASTALVQGNGNNGSLVCLRSMDIAIEKSKKTGFGIVASSNVTPFLVAATNPLRAANEGLIGVNWTATAAPGEVAPYGSKDPFMTVDPICIALPTSKSPIVLDMTWIESGGAPHIALQSFKDRGLALPDGWALDKEGNPTNDPDKAIESYTVLPIGGVRGSGFMVMLHLLAQGLVGELRENKHGGENIYAMEEAMTTTIYIAARPGVFVSDDVFKSTVSLHGDTINRASPRPGFDEVLLPGQRGDRSREIAFEKGFPIRDVVLVDKDSKEPYLTREVYEMLTKFAA